MELDFDVPSVMGRHNQLYHVGMACHRLETAMDQLGRILGVTWTPIADDTMPGLVTTDGPSDWTARRTHSIGSPVPLELLEGNPGSTWDTPEVAIPHHVAYWSRDVGADVRAMEAEGWTVEIGALDADGNPVEFAYMVKPGSVRVELVNVERRPAYLALTGRGDD
jgi:hypothetical protein